MGELIISHYKVKLNKFAKKYRIIFLVGGVLYLVVMGMLLSHNLTIYGYILSLVLGLIGGYEMGLWCRLEKIVAVENYIKSQEMNK